MIATIFWTLCARHCAKHFTDIISLSPPNNPMRWVLLSPFVRWGNQVLGYRPWPGSYTASTWQNLDFKLRLSQFQSQLSQPLCYTANLRMKTLSYRAFKSYEMAKSLFGPIFSSLSSVYFPKYYRKCAIWTFQISDCRTSINFCYSYLTLIATGRFSVLM